MNCSQANAPESQEAPCAARSERKSAFDRMKFRSRKAVIRKGAYGSMSYDEQQRVFKLCYKRVNRDWKLGLVCIAISIPLHMVRSVLSGGWQWLIWPDPVAFFVFFCLVNCRTWYYIDTYLETGGLRDDRNI